MLTNALQCAAVRDTNKDLVSKTGEHHSDYDYDYDPHFDYDYDPHFDYNHK